jgi:hypothetical protein
LTLLAQMRYVLLAGFGRFGTSSDHEPRGIMTLHLEFQ